jgi:hypothetical protein
MDLDDFVISRVLEALLLAQHHVTFAPSRSSP